ncbi:MAG: CvpA family protein, partial [Clostridia bacterium]
MNLWNASFILFAATSAAIGVWRGIFKTIRSMLALTAGFLAVGLLGYPVYRLLARAFPADFISKYRINIPHLLADLLVFILVWGLISLGVVISEKITKKQLPDNENAELPAVADCLGGALLGAILGVAVWVFWLNTMQANALMPKAENFLGRQLHQSKIVNRAMQPGFENWSYLIPTGMKSEMLVEVQAGGSLRQE